MTPNWTGFTAVTWLIMSTATKSPAKMGKNCISHPPFHREDAALCQGYGTSIRQARPSTSPRRVPDAAQKWATDGTRLPTSGRSGVPACPHPGTFATCVHVHNSSPGGRSPQKAHPPLSAGQLLCRTFEALILEERDERFRKKRRQHDESVARRCLTQGFHDVAEGLAPLPQVVPDVDNDLSSGAGDFRHGESASCSHAGGGRDETGRRRISPAAAPLSPGASAPPAQGFLGFVGHHLGSPRRIPDQPHRDGAHFLHLL